MLHVFDKTETLITILPKGSFFNPIHHEVLNGENTFEFSVHGDQEEAQYVAEGNLVAWQDLDAAWQAFEIKKVTDQHSDGLTRTAYCEHILYELLDDIVVDKRPEAGALAALDGMLEGTRWQTGIVDDLGTSSTTAYYEPSLSAVQKVATAWAGELRWRIIVSGNTIAERRVDLLAARGSDTGKQFEYSKDLNSVRRTGDSCNIYTAMYGRGKGVETESGTGYGRRLTFEDEVWSTASGDPANKPAGQKWVGDADALAQWGRPGGRHRFGIYTNEEQTDPAALLTETWAALQGQKTPPVSYELEAISLEELSGYSHEAVRLGDLVRVIDREFNPPLLVSARVQELDRDLIDPQNTKVVLGNFSPTIVDTTINTQREIAEQKNKTFNTSWLDGKISILQNEIENTAAYVFQTAGDGILIMNAPTFAEATKAMKLGGGVFALANSKTGDQWDWRAFGDGSGFSADEITTGLLNAGLIQIGPETTFAAGYDPSQAGVMGMGVDENTNGLWHFDESLNSHLGMEAVIADPVFGTGMFGKSVQVSGSKTLKIPGTVFDVAECMVNMRLKNLAASNNGAVILDLADNEGNQGIMCGISSEAGHEGELFIRDVKKQVSVAETTQADFNTGTLTDVTATSAGNLELAKNGTDFTYTETTQADFQSGTLTDVVATSAGDLELKNADTLIIQQTDNSDLFADRGAVTREIGQTFTPSSALTKFAVEVYVGVSAPPLYSLTGKIYATSSGLPTGSALATATVTHTASGWARFEFTVNLTANTMYAFAVCPTQAESTDLYSIYGDNGQNLYAGGTSVNWIGTNWTSLATWDLAFKVIDLSYKTSGTREKTIDLSGANPAGGTKIEWLKTTPTGTAVKVETALSTDGGSTYGAYQEATSGQAIPGIASDTDLSNAKLKIKETLSTTDTSKTPQLHNLGLNIYAPYKSSGYRYKVYDISAVGEVENSEISWTENVPTGTALAIKAALSTDGGGNYGAFQACTSGSSIPGLTQGFDVSNARLKIQEEESTSDGTKTPQLQALSFEVNSIHTAYGANKSTLTAWDAIVIEWKSTRLSLVVNGVESAYIENPGLPAALASYGYIGSDRSGANQIGTYVDELRIDSAYKAIAVLNAWYKMAAPFYSSEELKQFPGYLKAETDGYKVYDSSGNLRGIIGSWLAGAIRKYGIQVINGEIYSSVYRTGAATDTADYVEMSEDANGNGYLKVVGTHGGTTVKMDAVHTRGRIGLYDESGNEATYLFVNSNNTPKELIIRSLSGGGIHIGDGANTIVIGRVNGNNTDGIGLSLLKSGLLPLSDNAYNVGQNGSKWALVRATTITPGDLGFEERTCAICGQEFKPGDALGLIVKEWNEAGGTLTVPIHLDCKDTPATITLEVPEVAIDYALGDDGELIPNAIPAYETMEVEVITVNPAYTLDKTTGQFYRSDTPENQQIFGEEAIRAGVKASKKVALCSDTITRQVAKTKTITFDVNGGTPSE